MPSLGHEKARQISYVHANSCCPLPAVHETIILGVPRTGWHRRSNISNRFIEYVPKKKYESAVQADLIIESRFVWEGTKFPRKNSDNRELLQPDAANLVRERRPFESLAHSLA